MISTEARQALEKCLYPELESVVFDGFEGRLRAHFGSATAPVALDAGSGPGSWVLRDLRDQIGFLVGEDVYVPQEVLTATDTSRHLDAFVMGSCDRLPFADGIFDLVLSYLVIEHLSEPSLALREFARVLRPGGVFCFKTPAVRTPLFLLSRALPTSLHKRLKAGIGTDEGDIFPTYYRANTVGILDRELRAAGFSRDWLCTVDQTYAYMTHSRLSYAAGLLYSRLTQLRALAWLRNQIIGVYRVPTHGKPGRLETA